MVLLHGFDSSALEFRRLVPLLHRELPEVDVYALDVLGWGFTHTDVQRLYPRGEGMYSAQAKCEHLRCFLEQVVGVGGGMEVPPLTVLGASLGGALAVELISLHPRLVEKLVLVDAQAYLGTAVRVMVCMRVDGSCNLTCVCVCVCEDGAGPAASLPRPLTRLGVNVLKSEPLR